MHGPGGVAVRGAISDVCLGGLRVLRVAGAAPALPAGASVTVELECAGAGWVVQRGRVIRQRDGEVAIAFDVLAPEVEDLIEDEVLGALEAAETPRVVVIDGAPGRRARVAAALAGCGCAVLPAATPLEALTLIERSRNHVCAVALSAELTQTLADELVDYLAETHPDVRVARIESDDAEVVQLAASLRVS